MFFVVKIKESMILVSCCDQSSADNNISISGIKAGTVCTKKIPLCSETSYGLLGYRHIFHAGKQMGDILVEISLAVLQW